MYSMLLTGNERLNGIKLTTANSRNGVAGSILFTLMQQT